MAHGDVLSGWLARVRGWLRRPAAPQWLDLSEGEGDQGYGKDALKALVARKRRNELVRNREFESLRQLRHRSPASSEAGPGETHLSFFQNSLLPRHDERELTLRKIDEIEAQMSRQWWQAAPADAVAEPVNIEGDGQQAPTTQPALIQTPAQGDSGPVTITSEFAPTQMTDSEVEIELPDQSRARSPRAGAGAMEAQAVMQTDIELDEAALRFASGDAAGAAMGLHHALLMPDNDDGQRGRQRLRALLDVYRMTSEREKFDHARAEFSSRWGSDMQDAWPEPGGVQGSGSPGVAEEVGAHRVWVCPPSLTAEFVRGLVSIRNGDVLDWGALGVIPEEVLHDLDSLMARWCETPLLLHWRGGESLSRVLRRMTVTDDQRGNPKAWELRLKVLRILGAHDEFDLVALEYCLKFNLPVPLWRPALCVCESREEVRHAMRAQKVTVAHQAGESEHVCELGGDLLGDVSTMLAQLDAGCGSGQRCLVVSCARLGRIDLAAAGSLLNWLQGRQAMASRVELRDVSVITAAFFRVLDVDERAHIVVRGD